MTELLLKQDEKITDERRKSSSDWGYNTMSMEQNPMDDDDKIMSNATSSSSFDEEFEPHVNLLKPRPKKLALVALRELLLERAKVQRQKFKTNDMAHYNPNDNDITHLIKEFTVDFVIRGFPTLAKSAYQHQLNGNNFFSLLHNPKKTYCFTFL